MPRYKLGKRFYLGIGIGLLLAIPVSAQAGWKLQRAQAIAAAIWHHPCNDNVISQWGTMLTEGAVAESYPDRCTIVYSTQPTSWMEFCTTTIHEYGHLAGFYDPKNILDPYHSSNPHSVMAQNTLTLEGVGHLVGFPHVFYYYYIGFDKRCADHGRTYLGMRPTSLAHREVFD